MIATNIVEINELEMVQLTEHTYLFVDGLDVVARSYDGAVGFHPKVLLRPGGPLYPTDVVRQVRVASWDPLNADAGGVDIRSSLRGETVVWADLMYPRHDGQVIVEARFHLGQYVGEIERALAEHDRAWPSPWC